MKKGFGRKFWIGAAMLVILLTLLAAGRNLIHALKIRGQIKELEQEKALYEEKIARDSTLIERLKEDDFLEQYAREHYHMQRKGEKVYIIK
ncbi:septum formation initiator family protein [uncultured Alistipes sp.]|uniref:FtsB family cell division protein n=1 Tax=uncultured Alistipes sp. TaxID=538949 RepID=UPI002610639B|nr:septum formation initiator family protein [uncultured Alistipes sp.]